MFEGAQKKATVVKNKYQNQVSMELTSSAMSPLTSCENLNNLFCSLVLNGIPNKRDKCSIPSRFLRPPNFNDVILRNKGDTSEVSSPASHVSFNFLSFLYLLVEVTVKQNESNLWIWPT